MEKAYAGLIYCLLSTYRLAHERFTIKPTSEALEALNDHHDAIVKRRRGELRDVTSYAARWNEQAWRIAVCLHAGTHGAKRTSTRSILETAQRAIALADWFAEEQLTNFECRTHAAQGCAPSKTQGVDHPELQRRGNVTGSG